MTTPTALLTVDDLARALAVSPKTVRRLIASREIASVQIGRLRRVEPDALRAYLERRKTAAQVAPDHEQPAPPQDLLQRSARSPHRREAALSHSALAG